MNSFPLSSHISIFDIHLILVLITSHLSPQEVERCRSVSQTWRLHFHPFRRLEAKWNAPLLLVEQDRLWLLGPSIWTFSVPMDDRTFNALIESGRLSNLRELNCLDGGAYIRDPLYARRRLDFYDEECRPIFSPSQVYDLPSKVQKLLNTATHLQSLEINFGNNPSRRTHQQFSRAMLQALADHRTLTSLTLKSAVSSHLNGFHAIVNAILHNLPHNIETLELLMREDCTTLPLEFNERTEPYPRLWRVSVGHSYQDQIATVLVPFLRLCPRLEDLKFSGQFSRMEKAIADTLLEFCPLINNLDLFLWSTLEQMRLVRGYAFKKLRVRDFIFREDNTLDSMEILPAGSSTISCLALSAETLQVLNLESTQCRTRYHNLNAILLQFPNLKELSMDWFDFDASDPVALSITTRLEKLYLRIHNRQPEFADTLVSMAPLQLPILSESNDFELNNDDNWSNWDEEHNNDDDNNTDASTSRDLDISIPYKRAQSSIALAPQILRVYDMVARFENLHNINVEWNIYWTPGALLDSRCQGLDIRGPLMAKLMNQGLNRGALQRLNLCWTEHPAVLSRWPHFRTLDPKLKRRGFVLTEEQALKQEPASYGPEQMLEFRTRQILATRAALVAKSERDEADQEFEKVRPSFDIERDWYKNRNLHRAMIAKKVKERTKEKTKERRKHKLVRFMQ